MHTYGAQREMKDMINVVVVRYLNYHHKDLEFHTYIHFPPVIQISPKDKSAS